MFRGNPEGLSGVEIDRLLSLGSGEAALLYMYARRNALPFPESMPGFSKEQVKQALRQLCQAGLLAAPPSVPLPQSTDECPYYDSDTIAKSLSDPDFAYAVRQIERLLGKTLSSQDLQILHSMHDWRGLPAGVILLLVNYCIERQEHNGSKRRPTLRQIDREAAVWEHEQLFTSDLAEKYIERREKYRQSCSEVLRSMQIFREPAPTEKKYINEWLGLGFGHEAIALAYDKTVIRTGKLSWPYCDKILQGWHAQKLYTVPEIEAQENSSKAVSLGSMKTNGRQAPSAAKDYDEEF
ncbi:MAG: DnaD domain protein [Oscillospiraceae bacterium]|nr:DnaD domain protein [Oscillospiraceae bacterium]